MNVPRPETKEYFNETKIVYNRLETRDKRRDKLTKESEMRKDGIQKQKKGYTGTYIIRD